VKLFGKPSAPDAEKETADTTAVSFSFRAIALVVCSINFVDFSESD
jgi:hypothetical protein